MIASPIDGVVLARSVEPGYAVVASLQAVELLTLATDLRELNPRRRGRSRHRRRRGRAGRLLTVSCIRPALPRGLEEGRVRFDRNGKTSSRTRRT